MYCCYIGILFLRCIFLSNNSIWRPYADVIDDLVKTGKEVDAVYFASEAGLTEKFKLANLLKSYLTKSEKNSKDILKKGNNSSAAAVCLIFLIK